MQKQEQIRVLKRYKNVLLYLRQYQEKSKEQELQKVLVLKKKFGNKWIRTA